MPKITTIHNGEIKEVTPAKRVAGENHIPAEVVETRAEMGDATAKGDIKQGLLTQNPHLKAGNLNAGKDIMITAMDYRASDGARADFLRLMGMMPAPTPISPNSVSSVPTDSTVAGKGMSSATPSQGHSQ